MCYVNSLWLIVFYVSRSARKGLCVRVGHAVATRNETDWTSLFSCLNCMVRFEQPVVPTSDKLRLVMIHRVEFRVWSSRVVRWSMKIIWWYQGDVVSKSRAWHWTRYRDVLRWDPQSISDVAAADEPLRNRTKRSTSAKFETRKMQSTWYQLHKTSKIIEKLLLSTELRWFEKS